MTAADRDVIVVAHRGARFEAPENTLASFRRAIAAGADWLELDVRLTSDGRLAAMHDDKLVRTTGVSGRVSATTFEALRRLDAGSWFAPRFSSERIPALEEVVALARGRVGLFVEVKDPGARGNEVARALSRALEGFEGEAWVGSFDADFLELYKRSRPETPTALITRKHDGMRHAREARADGLSVSMHSSAAILIPRIKRAGMRAFAWTIASKRALSIALRWDVDAVVTDYPREVKAILGRVRSAETSEFGGEPPEGKAYLAWRRRILRKIRPWPRAPRPGGGRG